MNHYDIAAKVLIESCRDELIHEFLGIEIRESTMIGQRPPWSLFPENRAFVICDGLFGIYGPSAQPGSRNLKGTLLG